jgi:hypothetical protein
MALKPKYLSRSWDCSINSESRGTSHEFWRGHQTNYECLFWPSFFFWGKLSLASISRFLREKNSFKTLH